MKKVILILAASACLIIALTAQVQEIIHQNRIASDDYYYRKVPDLIKAQQGHYDGAARAGVENWLNVVTKSNGTDSYKVELAIPWPTPTVYREYRNGVLVKEEVNSTQLVK